MESKLEDIPSTYLCQWCEAKLVSEEEVQESKCDDCLIRLCQICGQQTLDDDGTCDDCVRELHPPRSWYW